MSGYRFPTGFLWGTSTSSHQVEGNNRWNDWWEYEQAGRLPFKSGDACRQFERFEQDFELARSWHQNAHRFSIEWSRIEPHEGTWNAEAVDHYRDVIRALRGRGLEPVVTLHHFTNPAWFLRRGGWLRRDSPRLFARYVERVAHQLGADVKYWLTINEPTVYAAQAFVLGQWPPFRRSAWTSAGVVLINLARAHKAAYRILHREHPQAMVSFAHSAPWIVPCDPRRARDRIAAAVRNAILNRAFFRLIGAGRREAPAGSRNLDFLGINYYSRTIVRSSGLGIEALLGRTCDLQHHPDRGAVSSIGWEVYPAGLECTLEHFARYGLPLLVTENGIATDDEPLRREFILSHLARVATALERGVDVFGYLYWSLIDNFEWAFGTGPRFGLAAVDFETQERRARPCVADFARICRENRL